ncbi:MAG: carboxyl transferase domain-containing protein [Desertimonas sp.]
MYPQKLLIANRGEIALRIVRTARALGISTVAVHAADDAGPLLARSAEASVTLAGSGPRAYLDIDDLVGIATAAECDAVHPGYGFLSENASFAAACHKAGLTFIGPRPEVIELFGDKARARDLAEASGIPVLAGISRSVTVDEAAEFFASLGAGAAMMIKAIAGGGGRGMRVVTSADAVAAAYDRCRSEAAAAFGDAEVYVERYLPRARHVEVQVAADRSGQIVTFGERECSLQRQHQKLIEIAPCPGLGAELRARLSEAAISIAAAAGYDGIGTFEFLIDADATAGSGGTSDQAYFMEANARIQVEHTVTEEVLGIDLVQIQLALAAGTSLADLGIDGSAHEFDGFAVQARVNAETLLQDGSLRPSIGTIEQLVLPSGPGVRVDTHATTGLDLTGRFDSLLAKVIVHHPGDDVAAALTRAAFAIDELYVDGLATNASLLTALLRHPDVLTGAHTTRFVEDHLDELVTTGVDGASTDDGEVSVEVSVDRVDPLAVLTFGKSVDTTSAGNRPAPASRRRRSMAAPPGSEPIGSPMQGTVVGLSARDGDAVAVGQEVLILESMKMEHVIGATVSGYIRALAVEVGDTVLEGDPLAFVEPADVDATADEQVGEVDLDRVRDDLAETFERHAFGLDERRPEAVARRRKTGQRTARENVAHLVDDGTFIEYGPLLLAAQRSRHSVEHLIERTPADGLVAGVGTVNGDQFPDATGRCVVMSYDYTVLAGTQGHQNHRKKDRLFELAERQRLPVVLFAEGGGGRPGDTDGLGFAGLDCMAFTLFGKLSGLVPLVGVVSGRCVAGNAALLGSCDVIIATENTNLGMGGPAMVEGGGLGVFRPEDIGPIDVQRHNGVVDVVVDDEAEAVEVAKRYLSYFQGATTDWECADQRELRAAIPENRLRAYDVRGVIDTMCDTDSVLELRREFGVGMITSLARIEGRPVGVIANNPIHLGGAIDADAADKAVHFMQLCDAFDLPILFLCDTPGIMVGPDSETEANVRHAARMFVQGANITVPFFTFVLRKGYGLGAQAMAGGSFHLPLFTLAWPTGEFGGMGLEGAVKLGYRRELEAIDDVDERAAEYARRVDQMYRAGKAINAASHFEIDGVIDPAESRSWIASTLAANPPVRREGKKRPCVDTW